MNFPIRFITRRFPFIAIGVSALAVLQPDLFTPLKPAIVPLLTWLYVGQTVDVQVGMQNSGLGVALAIKHFSAMAALPGAVFGIWHNLSGASLAAYWSRRPAQGGD